MLSLHSVAVERGGRPAVSNATLDVDGGEWHAIVGPNGAGKSSLIKAVCGLLTFSGTITFDGKDWSSLGRAERARLIGYVPQDPYIPDAMEVFDYVMLGRTSSMSLLAAPRSSDRRAVQAILQDLGSSDLAERRVDSLSGGERQRVVFARALVNDPRLLLLDEPTTGLDFGRQQDVLDLLDRLRHERDIPVLSALHDLNLVLQYADRVSVMSDGRTVGSGAPRQVITRESVAKYFGARVEVFDGPTGPVVAPVRRGEPLA